MLGIGRPFTWKSEGCDFGAYHPANISFGKLHIDLIYRLYNIVFQYVKWREANLFCWKAWVSQKRMLPTHWEHWEFPTPIFQYTYVTYVLNAVVTFSCPNSNRSESFRLDITSPSSPYFGGPNMFALNMSHVTCHMSHVRRSPRSADAEPPAAPAACHESQVSDTSWRQVRCSKWWSATGVEIEVPKVMGVPQITQGKWMTILVFKPMGDLGYPDFRKSPDVFNMCLFQYKTK